MPMPQNIFRGDQDSHRIRKVRENWNRGWLQTNLGDNGHGSELFKAPLVQLVERHVNSLWPKTHFLSFTADRRIAESFACGSSGKSLLALPENAPEWDTAILTLDCKRLKILREGSPGFFYCSYPHRSQQIVNLSVGAIARLAQDINRQDRLIPILLIDVLTVLNEISSRTVEVLEAKRKAERDREWLVLPMEPFETEYTALLDDSCISNKEKFQLI